MVSWGTPLLDAAQLSCPVFSESLDENFTSTEENQVTVNQTLEDETGTRQVASVLI
jgi:hypothetical protein